MGILLQVSPESEIEKLKTRKKKARDKNLDGEMSDVEFSEYVRSTNQEINELIQKKYRIEESIKNSNGTSAFTELKNISKNLHPSRSYHQKSFIVSSTELKLKQMGVR